MKAKQKTKKKRIWKQEDEEEELKEDDGKLDIKCNTA